MKKIVIFCIAFISFNLNAGSLLQQDTYTYCYSDCISYSIDSSIASITVNGVPAKILSDQSFALDDSTIISIIIVSKSICNNKNNVVILFFENGTKYSTEKSYSIGQ